MSWWLKDIHKENITNQDRGTKTWGNDKWQLLKAMLETIANQDIRAAKKTGWAMPEITIWKPDEAISLERELQVNQT